MTDMFRAGRRTWKCFAGFDVPQARGPPGAADRPPAQGSAPCAPRSLPAARAWRGRVPGAVPGGGFGPHDCAGGGYVLACPC